jgi:hypothetical protein
MGRSMRFLIVFLLQFVIAVIFVTALKNNDSELVTFSAGAAVMTFVLMLIIWLMSVISNKDIK